MLKWSKAKPTKDGAKWVDIAVPAFGHKNHVGIDRRHGLIRPCMDTDAACHCGAQLIDLLSKANIASTVWVDTAYRSEANEAHLAADGFRSRVYRKNPSSKPMARNVAHANGGKSKARAAVEHVFVRQKGPMALVVLTIGLARALMKIGLANLASNMNWAVWLTSSQTRAA
ncbi:hypothetical protein SAMN04487845_13722 [Methylobacterium sp. yr668]|nr:hypothetical protein SAMN04487845_13722 [Methylobacterium sp. yr668]